MRPIVLSLLPLFALAACSGSDEKDDTGSHTDHTDHSHGDDDDDDGITGDDDDDDTGDDDDDDDTGDDDDDTGDDDDDGPTGDTGLFYVTFSGDAVVTPGSSYVGSETIAYGTGPVRDLNMCQWTYDANNTSGPGEDVPCTDPDGNACEFQFEVAFTNGAEGPEVGGFLCAALKFPTDNGSNGYGFLESYQYMGTEYATDLWMYNYDFSRAYPSLPTGSYYWIPIDYADFDGTNFAYEVTNGPFAWLPSNPAYTY